MAPRYRHGDYVLVGSPRLWPLKTGRDVVCRARDGGLIFKRITGVRAGRLTLAGLNGLSIAPELIGPLPVSDAIGRVIWHVRRP